MGCSSSLSTKEPEKENKNFKLKRSKTGLFSQNLLLKNNKPINETYKFIEVLNNGSYFKLLKVLHLPTNQFRACKKFFKSNLKFINGEEAFMRELEFLGEMDHPNIPKLYEYFEEDLCYYTILELATGKKILDFIENIDYFCERQAAMIMKQILSCANYLHSQKIIHQNIFPDSIVMESQKIGDFNIKLMNFEKARMFDNQAIAKFSNENKNSNKKKKLKSQISLENNYTISFVKLYFIAPEITKGKVEFKSDIWACGILLYMLLCGYPPFKGETEEDLITQIQKCKLNFPQDDWGNISIEAQNFITKLLNLDPNKRLTAEQALKDPWILKYSIQEETKSNTDRLKINHKIHQFSSKQQLEQAAIKFMVHQNSSNQTALQLKEIFKKMDLSGDGRLTYEELKSGYEKYFKKTNLTEFEYLELIKNLDRDESQFVELEEFISAFINTETLLTEKNLEYAFNCFDDDRSGMLSINEIKKILGVVNGDKTADSIILQIMKQYDTNQDGQISFNEFKELMKRLLKQ